MCAWKNLVLSAFLTGALLCIGSAQAQSPPAGAQKSPPAAHSQSRPASIITLNEVIDCIIAREHDEIATIRPYNPIVETYVQDVKPVPAMDAVPVRGRYFSARRIFQRASWTARCFSKRKAKLNQFIPISHLGGSVSSSVRARATRRVQSTPVQLLFSPSRK